MRLEFHEIVQLFRKMFISSIFPKTSFHEMNDIGSGIYEVYMITKNSFVQVS